MNLSDRLLKIMDPTDRAALGRAGMTAEEGAKVFDKKAERDLQDLVANYLLLLGVVFGRNRMDKKSTNTIGWPDFVFAIRNQDCIGVPVAVECKSQAGTLSTDQEHVRWKMEANGWHYFLIRSLGELKSALTNLAQTDVAGSLTRGDKK